MTSLDPKWDPMREAYFDPKFNSYCHGPGANLEVIPNSRSGLNQKAYKLYVGNVPVGLTKSGLENLFLSYGQLLDVYRHEPDHETKTTWGFVTYGSCSEAEAAIRELNGIPPFGLKVQFALNESKAKERHQEEAELSVPLPLPTETAPSYFRQARGRGRGTINPFVDPRVGIDFSSHAREEDMDLHYFQPYAGSPFDYHNRILMSRPQSNPDMSGPMRVAMGRGAFDRARDLSSLHGQEDMDDMRDVLALLENKLIIHDAANFNQKKKFDVKEGSCTVCQGVALSMCELCSTYYCSEKCQMADWPQHKTLCLRKGGSSNGGKVDIKEVEEKVPSSPVSDGQTKGPVAGGDNASKGSSEKKNSGAGAVKKNFQKYDNTKKANDFKEHEVRPKPDGKVNGPKQWKQNEESNSFGPEKKLDETDTGMGKSFKKTFHEDKKGPSKNWKNERGQEGGPKVTHREGKPFTKRPDQENEQDGSRNFREGKQFPGRVGPEDNPRSSGPKRGGAPEQKGLHGKGKKFSERKEDIDACEELPSSHFSQVVNVLPLGGFRYCVQLVEKLKSVIEWSVALRESESTQITPEIGDYCAAQFENEWFRAKVTSVKPLKVLFIDYGNEESCEFSDLKALPDALRAFKGQAVKIQLAPGTPAEFENLNVEEVLKVKTVKRCDNGFNIVEVAGVEYSDSSDVEGGKQGKSGASSFSNVLATVDASSTGVLMLFEFDNPTFGIGSLVMDSRQKEYFELFDVFAAEFDSFPKEEKLAKGDVVAFRSPETCGRGFVLKVGKEVVVAGCDTGEIIVNPEVRKLSEKWKKLVWFMVQCTAAEEIIKEPFQQIQFNITVDSVNKVTNESDITLKCPNKNCKATLKPWDVPYELYKEIRVCEPQEGACYIIAYKSASVFYVRMANPETIETYNSVLQRVAAEAHAAQSLYRPPRVGEIVAALYHVDKNFFRARVVAIEKEIATVIFLDYGNEEKVKFEDLKPLSEGLRKEKATAVKVVLDNVRDRPLTERACKYLDSLIDQKVRLSFSVKNSPRVVLTAPDGVISVNVELNLLLVPSWKDGPQEWVKKPFSEFDFYPLDIGTAYEMLVTHIVAVNLVICLPKGSEVLHSLWTYQNDQMKEYCKVDTNSYVPAGDELCLARYEGVWYRAYLLENRPNEGLRMMLIDAGKLVVVDHTEVRQIPEEFCTLQAAAVFCTVQFKGNVVSKEKEIREFLKDRTVKAKVMSKNEDGYLIEIMNCPF